MKHPHIPRQWTGDWALAIATILEQIGRLIHTLPRGLDERHVIEVSDFLDEIVQTIWDVHGYEMACFLEGRLSQASDPDPCASRCSPNDSDLLF